MEKTKSEYVLLKKTVECESYRAGK